MLDVGVYYLLACTLIAKGAFRTPNRNRIAQQRIQRPLQLKEDFGVAQSPHHHSSGFQGLFNTGKDGGEFREKIFVLPPCALDALLG